MTWRTARSRELAENAAGVLAGGVTHPLRELEPHPIAIERADGSRKWDVDGNEYVDYVVGHGALLLGHGHPAVVDAVRAQVTRGTHLGGSHPAEVAWARLVCDLVPSAERVRFTSSGTEAVMLAVRVARAFTGRNVVVKFHGHFHGWSEIGLVGLGDEPSASGIEAFSPSRLDHVEQRLARGDVAAVIVEPSGAHFGQVPLAAGFLQSLRDVSTRHGAVLVFDEVVTGFRWAPGGVQEREGVTPDLTTLAKILGGGLPAGALAGRAEVMAVFDPPTHLFHPGTFNANPLSAAAGIATLREVATREPGARAEKLAAALRDAMNGVLRDADVAGEVYGASSDFHIYLGPPPSADDLERMRRRFERPLRRAMLSRGVDLLATGGMLSSAHTDDDLDRTVEAFAATVKELREGQPGALRQ